MPPKSFKPEYDKPETLVSERKTHSENGMTGADQLTVNQGSYPISGEPNGTVTSESNGQGNVTLPGTAPSQQLKGDDNRQTHDDIREGSHSNNDASQRSEIQENGNGQTNNGPTVGRLGTQAQAATAPTTLPAPSLSHKEKLEQSETENEENEKKSETTNGSHSSAEEGSTVCQNCQTSTTPLWRRDENGQVLCNACGLFLKLHGRRRPISLKTDVIKPRNRSRHNPSMKKAKNFTCPSPSQSPSFSPLRHPVLLQDNGNIEALPMQSVPIRHHRSPPGMTEAHGRPQHIQQQQHSQHPSHIHPQQHSQPLPPQQQVHPLRHRPQPPHQVVNGHQMLPNGSGGPQQRPAGNAGVQSMPSTPSTMFYNSPVMGPRSPRVMPAGSGPNNGGNGAAGGQPMAKMISPHYMPPQHLPHVSHTFLLPPPRAGPPPTMRGQNQPGAPTGPSGAAAAAAAGAHGENSPSHMPHQGSPILQGVLHQTHAHQLAAQQQQQQMIITGNHMQIPISNGTRKMLPLPNAATGRVEGTNLVPQVRSMPVTRVNSGRNTRANSPNNGMGGLAPPACNVPPQLGQASAPPGSANGHYIIKSPHILTPQSRPQSPVLGPVVKDKEEQQQQQQQSGNNGTARIAELELVNDLLRSRVAQLETSEARIRESEMLLRRENEMLKQQIQELGSVSIAKTTMAESLSAGRTLTPSGANDAVSDGKIVKRIKVSELM